MKLEVGTLEREQNPDDVDDSCFDSAEYVHMASALNLPNLGVALQAFLVEGVLQRHPRTHFKDDISSDQEHMWVLANYQTKELTNEFAVMGQTILRGFRTSNGNLVSPGYYAHIKGWNWLKNLLLLGQIILFWIPVRWNDGNNGSRLQWGYSGHAGDYRLFKQCLYHAPWPIRRLVSRKTLKKMSQIYWAPEPSIDWLLKIDTLFIEECL